MKKILFTSAFALIGTFAIANEIKTEEIKSDIKFDLLDNFQCTGVANNCGMALIYCWQGELDPDKLSEFRDKACADNDKEESAPEGGE
jgi:hypothetical protein